jgi:hypothetical protein
MIKLMKTLNAIMTTDIHMGSHTDRRINMPVKGAATTCATSCIDDVRKKTVALSLCQ